MVIRPCRSSTRRDLSRYDRRVTEHPDLGSFLSSALEARQILSIGREHPLDIHVSPAGADTTVVVFHAALTDSCTPLPIFAGASMLKPLDVNLVQVADPGLYADDGLTIGWFAGSAHHPVQRELVTVLEKVFDELGGSRRVFFGASAGGFAALYYGSSFPGSSVVCVNPQTILSNFTREHQEDYCLKAWGAPPEQVWGKSVDADLRETFDGVNHNDVLYVQNVRDPHVQLHMEPFLASIPDDRVQVLRGDWGEGHQAPSSSELSRMLSQVVSPSG